MTGPPPEGVALAEGLREMRARTGLSLAALAGRTAYSKSSWERYLNGNQAVPRQAVEALCALAAEPPARMLALWELADTEWSGRARYTRPASPPPLAPAGTAPGQTPADPGRARWWHPFIAGATAAALAVMGLSALALTGSDGDSGESGGPAPSALSPPAGCYASACDGKDPEKMVCGPTGRVESVGPEHRTETGAWLVIRYSATCAAGWGRLWGARIGDAIEISAPGAEPRRVVVNSKADTGAYLFTPMVGVKSRDSLRLCFIPEAEEDTECFPS
ncbi:hypothetical protein AA958_00245 [Streptomyces sp. CNQ-509]|uniref:helix-turn-helix domain-containing protein n=1 Tax=unclassified Streptomyces TaxID=2593676 RepID=UPI00062E0B66|nr:XRE family transcriptional regulator [Streptomyces sp. CNQ-509]AKH80856.1 hypothetical protein AA958_00245 [Streptomyces sp. CNQ-509]